MALIRGHHSFDDHFTQIPNDWLRDDRLSLEARGLLAQIMSHKPGWNLSIQSIGLQNKIGRDKVRRILGELFEYGYLERSEKQQCDEKGHLTGFDYVTKDPGGVAQEPTKAEPTKAEPTKVFKPPKNTIPLEEQLVKKTIDIESAFVSFWNAYPVKRDKRKARLAFERAVTRGGVEAIVSGAEKYRDDVNRDDAYTKYPEGWLNGDAWENGPLPARKKTRRDEAADRALDTARRMKELRAERGDHG